MTPQLKIISNRFEIQDLLGRGGMGDIYRAAQWQSVLEDEFSPQIVAVARERDHARDLDVTVAELLADLKDKGE